MNDHLTLPDFRAPGDILDRVTILELKLAVLSHTSEIEICRTEHQFLICSWDNAGILPMAELIEYKQLCVLNGLIWDAENRFREIERLQKFDDELPNIIRAAHKVNEERTELRRQVSERIVAEHGVDLIETNSSLDAFVDRIAIARLIANRTNSASSDIASALCELWIGSGLPDIFCGEDFCRLYLANDRLWDVKRAMDAWLYKDDFGADPVSVGRSLYLINDARFRAKVKIAHDFGSAFWETKKYPRYDIPANWDSGLLCWTGR
jgi:hypothetical protein